jgi:hypothetical protein
MLLSSYGNLIKNLPYLDQAFETKQATWRREYKANKTFMDFCDKTFESSLVKLSRADLFKAAERDFSEGFFSIIFWGYPRNMRGNSFSNILNSLEYIQTLLPKDRQFNKVQFTLMYKRLEGTGLGLSTLTKILYFFSFKVEDHCCLILDKRIIDVINSEMFSELTALSKITELNKVNKYVDYLFKMQELAMGGFYKPDQLELFLFHFGKNLKQTCE